MNFRMMFGGTLMAGLMMATTACSGGSDDASGADDADVPTMDPTSAAVAWTKCMRENGVDIPDPKSEGDEGGNVMPNPRAGGGFGVDPEVFDKAKGACKEYAEQMGDLGDETVSQEEKDRMLEFAECMRENGVDMPDPDLDAGDGQVGLTLPDDVGEDFEAAMAKCREFAPEMS